MPCRRMAATMRQLADSLALDWRERQGPSMPISLASCPSGGPLEEVSSVMGTRERNLMSLGPRIIGSSEDAEAVRDLLPLEFVPAAALGSRSNSSPSCRSCGRSTIGSGGSGDAVIFSDRACALSASSLKIPASIRVSKILLHAALDRLKFRQVTLGSAAEKLLSSRLQWAKKHMMAR